MALNSGEVEIVLHTSGGDRSFVLKPSLRALTAITAVGGNLQQVTEKIATLDLNTIASVIRAGANVSDRVVRDLPEMIWEHGLADAELINPIIRYIGALANGGRPPPETTTDDQPHQNGEDYPSKNVGYQ